MKRSKTQKSIKRALTTTAGALGALLSSQGDANAQSLPSIEIAQRVTITSPIQGQVIEQGPLSEPNCDRAAKLPPVTGTLRGFSRNDFDPAAGGQYELYINGKKLDVANIREGALASSLTFSEVLAQPYFPLSSVRGDDPLRTDAGIVTRQPRYPWSNDLLLGFDKRVRSILVEVVRADQRGDLDSYVVRDLMSYMDPRRNNCDNYDYEWKGFDQSVENGFSLQFTPRHLESLAPIVQENMMVPSISLAPGYVLSSTEAGPCTPYATLDSEIRSSLFSEIMFFRLTHPTVVGGVIVCADSIRTTLDEIERKSPSSVTIDPNRNPLTVSLDYQNISVTGSTTFRYRFVGFTKFGIPVSGDWKSSSCSSRTEVDMTFQNEPLVFAASGQSVRTEETRDLSVDSSSTGVLQMGSTLCTAPPFDAHRSAVKGEMKRSAIQLYEGSFNADPASGGPYNALTFAMDKAIYPLSTGEITPAGSEAGTDMRVRPTIEFIAGNPRACETGEKGLFVMQSFRNTPNVSSLWSQWGSWNDDDLSRLFETSDSRIQSTCPITGRDSSTGAPLFDATRAYESNLLMTTGPLNQLLAAKMGERLRWSFNSLTSAEGASMAAALGMEASESLSFEIESTLPPFLSPEWFYQAGHLRIQALSNVSSREEIVFEAASTFFLNQSVTRVLGLGIGSRSALDDVLGLSGSIDPDAYISTFHTLSNGSTRPSQSQLRDAFENVIKNRLSDYLLETVSGIGSVEYAHTLPADAPYFSVFENTRTTAPASVFIPSIFE